MLPFRCLIALLMPTIALAGTPLPTTPVVGLPCDGCELALDGLPGTRAASVRLATKDEPGEPLRLSGVVTDTQGRPQAGIILYAHQTDAAGIYPRTAPPHRHGRLRAWAQTDASGRYTFETVRPGAYPGGAEPQHIHMHVIEPGCALYYIDDVRFVDDPGLVGADRRRSDDARGGSGLVQPAKVGGIWQGRRDIVLGKGVNGYPACGRAHPARS